MPLDSLTTDLSRWPIVIHSTVGIPSDRQVDAFIGEANACLARRQPYVVIFDNTLSGRASTHMREMSMEWLKEHSEQLSQYCLGTGLVFPSAAFRFVMSTVMLVVSHPVEHRVCSNLNQALRWAEALVLDAQQPRWRARG